MTYAFAAAGTGGHVYPAIAVADALVAAGVSRSDIVFFGGDRMEATTIPAAGYAFRGVEMKGLVRSLTTDNLRIPLLVRKARQEIEREMQDRKVRAVMVFGGYISVPAATAGRRVGAKVFLHEQNAVVGLANRIVALRGARSYVAFAEARHRLRNASVVGNPLRSALAGFDRSALRRKALERYELSPNVPVLGVIGGSQGAKVLNDVTIRVAADADPGSFSIVHLTGRANYEDIASLAQRAAVAWRPIAFEDEMQWFYAATDVALSRAGALTMSELAATGTPAVAVPYGLGTDDHQAQNARALEAAGALTVIGEEDINKVPVELQQLLMDDARRDAMALAARRSGPSDCAEVIARDLIEAVDG